MLVGDDRIVRPVHFGRTLRAGVFAFIFVHAACVHSMVQSDLDMSVRQGLAGLQVHQRNLDRVDGRVAADLVFLIAVIGQTSTHHRQSNDPTQGLLHRLTLSAVFAISVPCRSGLVPSNHYNLMIRGIIRTITPGSIAWRCRRRIAPARRPAGPGPACGSPARA